MTNFFFGFASLVFIQLVQTTTHTDTCMWSIFRAACEKADMVLVIESALYGRIHDSSCFNLTKDEKPCYTDVRLFVERQCAGRRQCQINLPSYTDNLLGISSVCDRYRPQFLEVEFQCEQVYTAPDESCAANQPLIVNGPSGYLASIVTNNTSKGSSSCPWKFQLRSDQTVHLSLLDFGMWMETTAGSTQTTTCRIYARIKDSSSTLETPICGGENREKFLLSTTSELQIAVVEQDQVYFLIKYQVFDCPALDLPAGAVVDRSRYGIRVRCPGSNENVEFRCDKGEWTPKLTMPCPGQHTSEPTQSLDYPCPNFVSPNGTVFENVSEGLRVYCLNGDNHLIRCIGGRWSPDLPKHCTETASQTDEKAPEAEAAASPELSKILSFAIPTLVLFVALVVIVVVVVRTVCRNKRKSKIQMNIQEPVDNSYIRHRQIQQDHRSNNNRALSASEIYDELDESRMHEACGVAPPSETFLNRSYSLPMDEKLALSATSYNRRGLTLPVLRSQAEFQECSTAGKVDTTYLVPVNQDSTDTTYEKIYGKRNP